MENSLGTNLKNEWEKTIEYIYNINFYLKNYKEAIKDLCQEKKNLKEEIKKFNENYSNYEELERFSIPVIGKISCGKSTILNYLLDLEDSLQIESNTTTKFICIIRHNKLLKGKNPQLYSVRFAQRGELKEHYNFEKGDFIKGNIKRIIEQRNKDLKEKRIENIPQNYFYIIENYIPFFEGEYEKYSDYFEFLDIPGLNDISENIINDNYNDNDNIYFEKVIPFIVNNIKFSVFIFDTKNYPAKDSITIYKKYINILKLRYKNDEILNISETQNNSLYILNKIDLCDKKDGIKQEEEDFKNYLNKELNVNLKKK